MKNEDEIMFGNATLMLSLTEYQGLKNMPEPIKTQFSQPFCVNAYVKTQAYNLYQARFSSVSMDNMTSETLSRHIDCVEKGIPSPGQEDAFKNSDKQEELRKLNEFNLRRGCKIFCVYGNETFQIRIRYVVVFVGFCSRIFCRIYLSGYSISCPLSFMHAF